MRLGFDQAVGGPDQWEPLGKWLLAQGRIFLFVDWQQTFTWAASELVKASRLGARIVLVKPDSLPEGFEGLTFVTARLSTTDLPVKPD